MTTFSLNHQRVLDAIDLMDNQGEADVLARYGFGGRHLYRIAHRGRTYPARGIASIALGRPATEFVVDIGHVVFSLQMAGYTVLRGTRPVAHPDAAYVTRPDSVPPPVVPPVLSTPSGVVDPAHVFRSGVERHSEMRSFANSGQDFGVVATRLSLRVQNELSRLASTDVSLLVDSRFFDDVSSPDDFGAIVDGYCRLASVWRESLFVVAPDRVGDESQTLRRLESFSRSLRAMISLSTRVLVPMDYTDDPIAFARVVDDLVGNGWVPAFRCMKKRNRVPIVEDFVKRRRPAHVHLRALNPDTSNVVDYLPVFADPRTSFSIDMPHHMGNRDRWGWLA